LIILKSRYENLRIEYPEYRNVIDFFEVIFSYFEPEWSFYINKKSDLGGRPPVPRFTLQLVLIYLLYFSKDNISRSLANINSNQALKEILFVDDLEITRPTLNRFIDLLEESPLDILFAETVKIGLNENIITLNSHIIDTGKVIANVNPSRFLSFPTKTHESIISVIDQIDWYRFNDLDVKIQGRRYSVITRLKLLLLGEIAGLGSLGMVHKFIETYPYFKDRLDLGSKIPSLQLMRTWMSNKFYNSLIEFEFSSLWFELYFILINEPLAVIPKKVGSLDDLFGTLGTKYSRVDRGARIGYKTSNKSNWVGYKDHVSIDSDSGLPILITLTSGNTHDTREYEYHLKQIKKMYGDFSETKYCYADRGYDSKHNRELCSEILNAEPRIINRKATNEQKIQHKKWSGIRQAVERTIGRGVSFLRKNNPPFRGKRKVNVWVKMGYLIILMFGLSCYLGNEPELAHCISLYLK
jgi:IS5 family transposase